MITTIKMDNGNYTFGNPAPIPGAPQISAEEHKGLYDHLHETYGAQQNPQKPGSPYGETEPAPGEQPVPGKPGESKPLDSAASKDTAYPAPTTSKK